MVERGDKRHGVHFVHLFRFVVGKPGGGASGVGRRQGSSRRGFLVRLLRASARGRVIGGALRGLAVEALQQREPRWVVGEVLLADAFARRGRSVQPIP
jgi:hypothetical protein